MADNSRLRHESIYKNLVCSLPKHLRNIREDKRRVIHFLEVRWIPQRRKTSMHLMKISLELKNGRKQSNRMQIGAKSVSMAGKAVVCGGLGFAPLLPVGVAISLVADASSFIMSAVHASGTEALIKESNEIMKQDDCVTKQLNKLLSNFRSVLKDLEDDVDKFYKATKDGLFDNIENCSEEIQKFLNYVRSIDSLTPAHIVKIVDGFIKLFLDAETRARVSVCFQQLFHYNPALRDCAVEVGRVAADVAIGAIVPRIPGRAGIVARGGAGLLNVIFIAQDGYDIVNMAFELKHNCCTTEAAEKLDSLVRVLEEELRCMEKGVEKAKRDD